MRRLSLATITAALACGLVTAMAAQKTTDVHPGKGGSPHVRTAYTVDGAAITIEYGRPSLKGRPEATLMPPGKPWRTGADEATLITTDKPLTFGALKLQPGTYTINTQPGEQWQLIVGKVGAPGQWGIPYKPELEVGRAPMTVGKTNAPVETLTIAVDDTSAGGTLRIEWGGTRATAPFTVG